IDASSQVELYDEELKLEPYRRGIATLDALSLPSSPEEALKVIESAVVETLDNGKIPFMLGGEHTVTLAGVRACKSRFESLGVIHLDAHADLRDSYLDKRISHATVLRRSSEICPALGLGIRSLSVEEAEFLDSTDQVTILTVAEILAGADWSQKLADLPDNIYLTVDIDVLDPSEMPAVGTPEPGGLRWYELLAILRTITETGRVTAVDIVELCPPAGPAYAAFTAAKLAYRLMGYLT
ncbi:MAG: agmatinase family protein, partial [bacterium]|nr:agmatinase family protein [bacterium]